MNCEVCRLGRDRRRLSKSLRHTDGGVEAAPVLRGDGDYGDGLQQRSCKVLSRRCGTGGLYAGICVK